jgi:hypothetical protein
MSKMIVGRHIIGARIGAFIGSFIEMLARDSMIAVPGGEGDEALDFCFMLDRTDW